MDCWLLALPHWKQLELAFLQTSKKMWKTNQKRRSFPRETMGFPNLCLPKGTNQKQRFNLPQWLYLVGAAMGYNENTMKLFKGITWYITNKQSAYNGKTWGIISGYVFRWNEITHLQSILFNEGFKQHNTRIYGYCGIYIHIWYIYIWDTEPTIICWLSMDWLKRKMNRKTIV